MREAKISVRHCLCRVPECAGDGAQPSVVTPPPTSSLTRDTSQQGASRWDREDTQGQEFAAALRWRRITEIIDESLTSHMSAQRNSSSVIEVIAHHKTDSLTSEVSAAEKKGTFEVTNVKTGCLVAARQLTSRAALQCRLYQQACFKSIKAKAKDTTTYCS